MIWEHLGMLDDPEYRRSAGWEKVRSYLLNGYIPGVNLILTAETADAPMGPKAIEEMVELYFG